MADLGTFCSLFIASSYIPTALQFLANPFSKANKFYALINTEHHATQCNILSPSVSLLGYMYSSILYIYRKT